jgi:gas vesicle protein
MNKLISLGIGLAVGVAIGVVTAVLVAPSSGAEFKGNLRRGYDETFEEARRTSQQRKLELEAELKRKRGRGLTLP